MTRFFTLITLCFFLFACVTTDRLDLKRGQTEETKDKNFLVFEGVYVTGRETYPLEKVLAGLDIDRLVTKLAKDAWVLSVGEGTSDLVEIYFRKNMGFKNSYALDPLYGEKHFPNNDAGKEAEDYIHRNQSFLFPYYSHETFQPDNSYDLIVSHMLVNNLIYNSNKFAADTTLEELYRITKPGGHIFLLGFQIFSKVKKFGNQQGKNWADPQFSWEEKELKTHVEKKLVGSLVYVTPSKTNEHLYLLRIQKPK